jgi:condensin complex subunit 1
MDTIDFDLNDALKHYMSDPASIATPEAHSALFDCENDPEALTNPVVNSVLNPIVDAVADNPDAIMRASHMDSLQFLLKLAPISLHPSSPEPTSLGRDSELVETPRYTAHLPTHALSKIFDLIMSGLSAEADSVHSDIDSPDEQDSVPHHKKLLEIYAFLLQWTIAAVETKAAEKSSAVPASRGRGKPKKGAAKDKEAAWDSATQLQAALEIMCKVLKLKLSKIFLTTSERDTFIGLLTRPVYMVLESEQRVKATTIRMHCFKVLCIAVKHHGHAYGMLCQRGLEWIQMAYSDQRRKSTLSRTSPILNICRNPWPSFYTFWPRHMTIPSSLTRSFEKSVTRNSTPTILEDPSPSLLSSPSCLNWPLAW